MTIFFWDLICVKSVFFTEEEPYLNEPGSIYLPSYVLSRYQFHVSFVGLSIRMLWSCHTTAKSERESGVASLGSYVIQFTCHTRAKSERESGIASLGSYVIRFTCHTRAKSKRESDVASLGSYVIQFTCHTRAKNNPIASNVASEIAFAFALVWLDH